MVSEGIVAAMATMKMAVASGWQLIRR